MSEPEVKTEIKAEWHCDNCGSKRPWLVVGEAVIIPGEIKTRDDIARVFEQVLTLCTDEMLATEREARERRKAERDANT